MAVDDVDDPCPAPHCDLPYTRAITIDQPFQQKTVNLTAAKQCYCPTTNGGEEPAVLLVYHTYDDIASVDWETPRWADEADVQQNADPDHPRDLSGKHATVFEIIREATAEDHSILMADLRPAAKESGVPPDDLYPIVLNLIYHEFVVENEDAVFKVPGEVIL